MEKVLLWCGQPSDGGRLKNRTGVRYEGRCPGGGNVVRSRHAAALLAGRWNEATRRAGGTVASYTSCKLRVHAVAAGFCCTAVITSADAAARDNDGSPHMT